jgi:hypothetical protein
MLSSNSGGRGLFVTKAEDVLILGLSQKGRPNSESSGSSVKPCTGVKEGDLFILVLGAQA